MLRLAALFLFAFSLPAQELPPEYGAGWEPEFDLAARRILALAEAIPAGKYAFKPTPAVRSVSEVLMHIALDNYSLLTQAIPGYKFPRPATEKTVSTVKEKAAVLHWLKGSIDAVREQYPKANRQLKVKFVGKETTSDGVFLRILVHNHEHMGQMVAYARMAGVPPPWSN